MVGVGIVETASTRFFHTPYSEYHRESGRSIPGRAGAWSEEKIAVRSLVARSTPTSFCRASILVKCGSNFPRSATSQRSMYLDVPAQAWEEIGETVHTGQKNGNCLWALLHLKPRFFLYNQRNEVIDEMARV